MEDNEIGSGMDSAFNKHDMEPNEGGLSCRLIKTSVRLQEYAADNSLEELLTKALDEIGGLVNSPIGFFKFLRDDQLNQNKQYRSTRILNDFCRVERKGSPLPNELTGVCADCIHQKTAIIHNDHVTLKNGKGLPDSYGAVVRKLVVPVIRGSEVVAILGVGNKPTDYTKRDLEIVSYIADILWNIALQSRSQEQLQLTQFAVDHIHDSAFWIDKKGRFKYVNKAVSRNLGYSRDELLKMTVHDVDPNFPAIAWSIHWKELCEQKRMVFESIHKAKDGSLQPVKIRANYLEFGGKEYNCAFATDITERKQMAQSLRESEGYQRALLQTIPDLIWLKDTNGIYLACNTMFEKFFGATAKRIIGKTDYDFVDKPLADLFLEQDQKAIAAGKPTSDEKWHTFADDGRPALLETIKTPMFDDQGKLIGVLGISRDITERIRTENEKSRLRGQLQQAQKMESIGTLAGGIAHDFNNILSSIIGFTELALDQVAEKTEIEDDLQEIYSAAKRARDLVKQILAFARQSDEERRPIQPSVIVKEVVKFIRSTIPTTVKIRQDIQSDAYINGNATQVHQVLMNLCTNAAQAMEETGGVLETGVKDLVIDSRDSHSGMKPGNYIQITVADSGVGIAPDVIGSIFEPYFTTKGYGEGTGMGLSVAHGIIESYGGKISVKSIVGKGSTFQVYLPVIRRGKIPREYSPQTPPSGTERILLVDDEFAIAKMSSKTLKGLGYSVTTRTSSIEALELFRTKPNAFDLIITDMTMPNLTGDELASKLMDLRPDIPIILCTGYSKKISEETALQMGVKAFLYKPLAKEVLAKTIRKVLDEDQSGGRG
jgi:PAS domain S-box-containing protein